MGHAHTHIYHEGWLYAAIETRHVDEILTSISYLFGPEHQVAAVQVGQQLKDAHTHLHEMHQKRKRLFDYGAEWNALSLSLNQLLQPLLRPMPANAVDAGEDH